MMEIETFQKLARKGNLIAVTEVIPADLETPVSCFLKLAGNTENGFLLESAEQDETIGRYSIIGLKPQTVFSAKGEKVTLKIGKRESVVRQDGRLLEAVCDFMKRFKVANPESLPGFGGGFVGYFGYENVEHFEEIRLRPKRGLGVPDGVFYLSRDLVIFDHFRKQMTLAALVGVQGRKGLTSQYQAAVTRIKGHIRKLRSPLTPGQSKRPDAAFRIRSNMTPEAFKHKVKRIREYIRAGDCIQVVLSQRFSLAGRFDDFKVYRALRSINPSPYMFYFRYGKFRLVGSSPELLVKKTGNEAEVRPIAGTRPRGKDTAADMRWEENLKKSPKEMAEHLMLVDLGRNDLGRVSRFDSVKVKNFARVERYSHVMHLVSDVTAKLKPGKDAFDLLRATFPAGTLTGAPKIRAMQIIDELETEKRGPYGGSVGYFSFNGDMDMCITIRTLVVNGRKMYLQAGAGIVKDSNPAKEYQETVNKAKALLKAVQEHGKFECY